MPEIQEIQQIDNEIYNIQSEDFLKGPKGDVGPSGPGTGDMLRSVYDTDSDGIVDNAEKVNNHTVNADVPSGAETVLNYDVVSQW